MKIKTNLVIVALIPLGVALVIGSTLVVKSSQDRQAALNSERVSDLRRRVFEQNLLTAEFLLHPDERERNQWDLANARLKEILSTLRFDDPRKEQIVGEIRNHHKAIEELYSRLASASAKNGRSGRESPAYHESRRILAGQLLVRSNEILASAIRLRNILRNEQQRSIDRMNTFVMILVVATAAAAGAIALLISRNIAHRLGRLCGVTETIASGNLECEAEVGSGDEIGELSLSINKMTGRLKESYSLLQREIGERRNAEGEVRKLNAELVRHVGEIEAANRELESFSYSVSHDLRAPLRAIDGFSRVMLEEYAGTLDAEGRRLLGVIRSNTQRMAQLIDDLLAFSRLGRREMVLGVVDMGRIAREAFEEASGLSPDRNIRFLADGLPPAFGDAALLRQVLANLLDNAIKFTRPRETAVIEVSGREGERENVYWVTDNGVGFDMRYVDKLFRVFQRLHAAMEFEGTGVGLAIVQRIVHRHGGRVWAEGAPGNGASFYLTLPKA